MWRRRKNKRQLNADGLKTIKISRSVRIVLICQFDPVDLPLERTNRKITPLLFTDPINLV